MASLYVFAGWQYTNVRGVRRSAYRMTGANRHRIDAMDRSMIATAIESFGGSFLSASDNRTVPFRGGAFRNCNQGATGNGCPFSLINRAQFYVSSGVYPARKAHELRGDAVQSSTDADGSGKGFST